VAHPERFAVLPVAGVSHREAELIELSRAGLASFKCPWRVGIVDVYPPTATGGVRLVELRSMAGRLLSGKKGPNDRVGQSWGKTWLAAACHSKRQLAGARVLRGQRPSSGYSDVVVVHGKEKVYGSIP
jgi:hypothetical protein